MTSIDVRRMAYKDLAEIYPQFAQLMGTGEPARAMTLATLEWFFRSNPAGQSVCAGAFDGDKLVCVTSIVPKPFCIGGEAVTAAEVSAATTDAAYRGRGLFSRLVTFLIEDARDSGYAFLYATPNPASGRIFLGKLGFTPLFHWNRSARAVAWNAHPSLPGLVRRVAPVMQPAWEAAFPLRARNTACTTDDRAHSEVVGLAKANDARCAVDRTAEYLDWRYSRPGRTYGHLHCRRDDGALVGWAATAFIREGERRRIRIGDWWTTPDRSSLHGLLAGARDLAGELGATELYIAGRRPTGPEPDRRYGFVTRASQRPVIGFSLHMDVSGLHDWDYREADADMF